MQKKTIGYTIGVVAVIIIILVVLFMLNKQVNPGSQDANANINVLSKYQAEKAASDANQDWVLDLNPVGRAEVYNSNLEGNTWVVKVRNYERVNDQIGYLLLYRVDAITGVVEEKTLREEITA